MSKQFAPFVETLKALEDSITMEMGVENLFVGDALHRVLALIS